MALGLPGRLTISDLPRMPATCRDRMAVGTTLSDTARICSPKPSSIFSQTASVGRDDETTILDIAQLAQGLLDERTFVGNQTRHWMPIAGEDLLDAIEN